jgi:hypothetical protein
MAFTPKVNAKRPWFEAKLKAGAISSVAAATGTPQRTTFATGSVTLPQLAGVVMALLQDLNTRGVVK